MDKAEFKKNYGFNSGSFKWIPKGGDLLECIGQRAIRVSFLKSDDNKDSYTSKEDQVLIKSIWGYNKKTMTYQISYTLPDSEEPEKVYTEEIIPEGFSTSIVEQSLGGDPKDMHRFIPGYLHLRVIQEDLFFNRLFQLYTLRKTLTEEELYAIDRDRDQNRLLNYCRNIYAICLVDGQVCGFRLSKLKIRRNDGGSKRLTVYDSSNNSVSVVIEKDSEEYTIPDIGTMKIIDICGDEEKNSD